MRQLVPFLAESLAALTTDEAPIVAVHHVLMSFEIPSLVERPRTESARELLIVTGRGLQQRNTPMVILYVLHDKLLILCHCDSTKALVSQRSMIATRGSLGMCEYISYVGGRNRSIWMRVLRLSSEENEIGNQTHIP